MPESFSPEFKKFVADCTCKRIYGSQDRDGWVGFMIHGLERFSSEDKICFYKFLKDEKICDDDDFDHVAVYMTYCFSLFDPTSEMYAYVVDS